MYEKELGKLGLGEKEAKVYLAALELGPETAQNLAKKAGVNRPTAYVQIESLKKRGLMSEFEKGKKTYYSPESPQRLEALLRSLESDLAGKKSDLQSILPFLLSSFSGAGERPKVRFFEGTDGISAIREDFLKAKNKNIEGFIDLDNVLERFNKNQDSYTAKRVDKKIQSKLLYIRKQGPLEGFTDPKKLRTGKFIKKSKHGFNADITIYDSKVAIISYNVKTIGVIIENQSMADTMRSIFYLIWDNLE
jgi:sugar-specific transcriptional regulator TrmB